MSDPVIDFHRVTSPKMILQMKMMFLRQHPNFEKVPMPKFRSLLLGLSDIKGQMVETQVSALREECMRHFKNFTDPINLAEQECDSIKFKG